MKKTTLIIIGAVLVAALSGCSGPEVKPEEIKAPKPAGTRTAPPPAPVE